MDEAAALPPALFDLLALESSWRALRNGLVKEQVVKDRFGISMPTYYARLNAAIDHPAAERIFGTTVRRRRAQLARRRASLQDA